AIVSSMLKQIMQKDNAVIYHFSDLIAVIGIKRALCANRPRSGASMQRLYENTAVVADGLIHKPMMV
ncbi:MAG: hypothetical protein ACRCVV_09490, partial [Shewanella sp.]